METLEEVKNKLAENFGEVDLVEMLGLTSYDIVERYSDLIEDRLDYFVAKLDEIDVYLDGRESETPKPEEG